MATRSSSAERHANASSFGWHGITAVEAPPATLLAESRPLENHELSALSGSAIPGGDAGTRKLGAAPLHTNARAARMCAALGTSAFSFDGHVFSTRPLDTPRTPYDRQLRAHEYHHVEAHTPLAPGVIFRGPPPQGEFKPLTVAVDGERGDTAEKLSYKALARLYGYEVSYVQTTLLGLPLLTEIKRPDMANEKGALAESGKIRFELSAQVLTRAAAIFGLPPTRSPFSEGERHGSSLSSANHLIQDLIAAGDAAAAGRLLWSREDEISQITADDRVTFVQVLMNYKLVGTRPAKKSRITRFGPPDCPTAPRYQSDATDIPPEANRIVEEISVALWERYLYDYRVYLDRYIQQVRDWNSWFKVREKVGLLADPCPIPVETGRGPGRLYVEALNAPLDKIYELADVKKPGTVAVSAEAEVALEGSRGKFGGKISVAHDSEGRESGTAAAEASVKLGKQPEEGAEQDNRSQIGGAFGVTLDDEGRHYSSDKASVGVGGDSANIEYNAAKEELSVGGKGVKLTGKKDELAGQYAGSGGSVGKTEADYDGDGKTETYGKGSASASLPAGAKSSASFDEATGDVELGVGVEGKAGDYGKVSAGVKVKVKMVGGFEQMLIARALGRGQSLLTQPVGERHVATEELLAGKRWNELAEDRRLNLVLQNDWSKSFWNTAIISHEKQNKSK